MSCVWNKVCPNFVDDFSSLSETIKDVKEKVVTLGTQFHLELKDQDINQFESHAGEASSENCIELVKLLEGEKKRS